MIETEIFGNEIKLETNNRIFSPKAVDLGTIEMLKLVKLTEKDKVMDLGCGCGVVGISIAKVIGDANVFMIDIDENAVACSKSNAILNNVENVTIISGNSPKSFEESGFTLILSNPPYHADFSVPKNFIEEGYKKIEVNGKMIMVVKRLDWYKNKMNAIFGNVRFVESNGYFVIISIKHNRKIVKEEKAPTKKHLKKMGKSSKSRHFNS